MVINQKIYIMIAIIFALSGCKEKLTLSYLLQHPMVLKQEVAGCYSATTLSQQQTKQCQMMITIHNQLLLAIQEEQQDPEQLGEKILLTEMAASSAQQDFYLAQQAVVDLHTKRSAIAELRAAVDRRKQAQETYLQRQAEVQIMLAVISMSRPE